MGLFLKIDNILDTINVMKLNQNGSSTGLIISLVTISVLFIGSVAFGFWAYSGRQNYKNNANQLISTAVSNAKQEQQQVDNKAFFVEEQKPLIKYVGPQSYGTITVYYPRNWSSYVNTSSNGYPVDGYFFPGTLPSVTDSGSVNFALRLQVDPQPYSTTLAYYSSEVTNKLATVTAYSLPKVSNVVGVKVVGELQNNTHGTIVILPLRNETLEVWTEGTAYLSEFNTDILPNLSFSP